MTARLSLQPASLLDWMGYQQPLRVVMPRLVFRAVGGSHGTGQICPTISYKPGVLTQVYPLCLLISNSSHDWFPLVVQVPSLPHPGSGPSALSFHLSKETRGLWEMPSICPPLLSTAIAPPSAYPHGSKGPQREHGIWNQINLNFSYLVYKM